MLTNLSILLSNLSVIVAQGKSEPDAAPWLAIIFSCCCPLLVFLALFLPMVGGAWKAFAKAGQPGWAVLVPIYNWIIFTKIAGKEDNRWIFYLIPVVGPIFQIIDTFDFAKAYGKETGFALGLILVGPVFWAILGFGSARTLAFPRQQAAKAALEDEEEEEPRPRRRRRREDDEE